MPKIGSVDMDLVGVNRKIQKVFRSCVNIPQTYTARSYSYRLFYSYIKECKFEYYLAKTIKHDCIRLIEIEHTDCFKRICKN